MKGLGLSTYGACGQIIVWRICAPIMYAASKGWGSGVQLSYHGAVYTARRSSIFSRLANILNDAVAVRFGRLCARRAQFAGVPRGANVVEDGLPYALSACAPFVCVRVRQVKR